MITELKGIPLEWIDCPMVGGTARTLKSCKACPEHEGIREFREANPNNGSPAGYQVLCRWRRVIVIKELIVDKSDAPEFTDIANAAGGLDGGSE